MDILNVKGLCCEVEGTPILKGVDLDIRPGEIHVIMGPNGAGKSTLSNVLMGHPAYEVTAGEATFLGKDLLELKVDERARMGMFLSFQYPHEIPGITVEGFIRQALTEKNDGQKPSAFAMRAELDGHVLDLALPKDTATRSLNQGFSGGEKKKNEMLQMAMLNPVMAILDETDSGLDVDAIRIVYENIQAFSTKENGILVITHYNKILKYIKPDVVHIMVDGKIVQRGDASLADQIEQHGYDSIKEMAV